MVKAHAHGRHRGGDGKAAIMGNCGTCCCASAIIDGGAAKQASGDRMTGRIWSLFQERARYDRSGHREIGERPNAIHMRTG